MRRTSCDPRIAPCEISAPCTVYLAVTPATPRKPLLPTDFIPPTPLGVSPSPCHRA